MVQYNTFMVQYNTFIMVQYNTFITVHYNTIQQGTDVITGLETWQCKQSPAVQYITLNYCTI